MTGGGDQAARTRVLSGLRRALGRGPLAGARRSAAEQRLARPPRGPIPGRAAGSRQEVLELFQRMAEEASATTERLATFEEVPPAVARYLKARNLPSEIRLAPHPELTGLAWARGAPLVAVDERAGTTETAVGVSRGFAGVAETGTLVLYSRRESPSTLNFLPATHVVVLRAAEVLGCYEDAWDRLRRRLDGVANWPRTVNLITGPSRSADIEQTLQLGAHGPMNLHVLLVGDADGSFGGDAGG